MTAEEQEVYAHMGISPLVFVNREIKDLRNVIVSVALPGQAPSLPPSLLAPISTVVESDEQLSDELNGYANGASDLPFSEPIETLRQPVSVESARGLASNLIDRTSQIISVTNPPIEPMQEVKEEVKEEVVESPAASRRRRRTSASEPSPE